MHQPSTVKHTNRNHKDPIFATSEFFQFRLGLLPIVPILFVRIRPCSSQIQPSFYVNPVPLHVDITPILVEFVRKQLLYLIPMRVMITPAAVLPGFRGGYTCAIASLVLPMLFLRVVSGSTS